MKRSTIGRLFCGSGTTTSSTPSTASPSPSQSPSTSTTPTSRHTEHPFSSRSTAEKASGYGYGYGNNNSTNCPPSASSAHAHAHAHAHNPDTRLHHLHAAVAATSATAATTPASCHSLSSPSPSPQPATPDEKSRLPDRDHYFGVSASATVKPLTIANSPRLRDSHSASPRAAQRTQPGFDLDFSHDLGLQDNDVEMTSGPALDSAFGRSRQDSFVSAGPKPISMINPNREHGGRRESVAGSYLNGMSWGGVSVGSFIRDDLAMTGTSPFMAGATQSPSFSSNSYIPKMEAEYLRNFVCCELKLETMHDLLRHYETVHTTANAQSNRNGSGVQMPHRLSVSSRPSMSMGLGRQDSHGFQSPGQLGFGSGNRTTTNNGISYSGFQMGRQDSNGPKSSHLMQSNDDMDAVGDMEMDDAVGMMEMDDTNQRTIQQTRQMFGQQQRPQLQLNSSGLPHQALRTSQPPTPGASGFGFQNNPTVSSVNTPTLTTHQAALGQLGGDTDGLEKDASSLNYLDLTALGAFDNPAFSEFFIQDPAKRLYNPNGGPASQLKLQQQMQQFGLDQSQFPNITDPNHLAALQRAIANPNSVVMPPEEDKPFKCPVIGCEKAYKNQNGLKYHKQHGHQNQQLHENGDGSFSIVNPETSAPYPGETGMEKEKPHKCEYCHKRYKNLNGLKYHKQHSSACEIQAQAASIRANLSNNQMPFNMAQLNHGLPGIGEEMQM
ncbi:Uu.00g028190.m01.CDS01 [Anthostomella pinea]|uniref:Uu.00g028190.m01.CDS01 n=1 Tax=Anthostomella pinea TaxID=933095 RepID=A0AAI8YCP1_9PEZI|nr:Uu.00g028190.m01.CDS01 [Anthostomella pinea]